MSQQRARALAALHGLAVGDALGMPTQSFPREEVARRWPHLAGFVAAPSDQPVAPGLPAGHVTDDTEQALLLARLLVTGEGRVDPYAFARALLAWEREVAARGSLDLLGPSTKRAVEAIAAGADPRTTGRAGTTNGSAMRVTPVGIAVPPRPLRRLVDAVEDAGRISHHTSVAHAAAAAVAAAVSAGVDGASVAQALELATEAADLAAGRGTPTPGADFGAALRSALDLVRRAPDTERALDLVAAEVGTGLAAVESVPAALAVAARHPDDAWAAGLAAARLGDDSDTIAAIACAVVAACGGGLPAGAVATVRRVNDLDLAPLVEELLAIRQAGRA